MNERFPRREFLRRLMMAGGTAVFLPMASRDAQAASAGFVPAGKATDFKPGEFKAVTLAGGAAIHLRRLPGAAPRFQAFSALCTHKGCPVAWLPREKQFRCPCHAGRFDANGKNIAGPPPAPLPALKTKVVKGVVMVAA